MKSLKPILLTFSLLAFTGAYAQTDAKKEAQGTQAKPPMSQADTKAPKGNDAAAAGTSAKAGAGGAGEMSAKNLIGKTVVDPKGEKLGEIDDVVLDLHNGRVHAAVLEFGGFLGLGEKRFAFPASELKPGKNKDQLALDMDKEKLKNEKGFEKGKWPAMNDAYWGRVGGEASAGGGQQGQKMNLVRASELMGKDVQDKAGKDVGEIRDVAIGSDHRIQHIVVNVQGAGQAQIDPKELTLGTGDKLVVNTSADELKSQAKPEKDKRAQGGERTRPMERDRDAAGRPGGAAGGAAGGGAAAGGATAGASADMKKDDMKQNEKQTQADTKKENAQAQAGQKDQPAPAAGGATAGGKSFSELDMDNDGSLSPMEAAADKDAKANFAKLDKNSDKKLTRSEFEAGAGAAAGATQPGMKSEKMDDAKPAQSK